MWKLTSEQKSEVADRFSGGESVAAIAQLFGVSSSAVRALLHRRGYAMSPRREAATRRTLNHAALDVLTPEAAYWCGFLFADGSIALRSDGAATVAIVLTWADRGHLEKFRDFLGSTHAITAIAPHEYEGRTTKPACRFSVRSDRLAERLCNLGRYGAPVDSGLAQSPHFWRGVVDGDGYVGVAQGIGQFKVVGSKWLLEAFVDFLDTSSLKHRLSVRPHKSIWVVGTSGSGAERIAELLYRDPQPGLDRKVNAARNIAAGRAVTARGGLPLGGPVNREPLAGAA